MKYKDVSYAIKAKDNFLVVKENYIVMKDKGSVILSREVNVAGVKHWIPETLFKVLFEVIE